MAKTVTKSWFPIKIKFSDTKETMIVRHPKDLPNGQSFKVLETRVVVRHV